METAIWHKYYQKKKTEQSEDKRKKKTERGEILWIAYCKSEIILKETKHKLCTREERFNTKEKREKENGIIGNAYYTFICIILQ